jgi:hypothetical protein
MNREPHKRTDTLAKALELDKKKTHKERCILFYPLIVDFEKCSLVSEGIYNEDNKKIVTPTKCKIFAL